MPLFQPDGLFHGTQHCGQCHTHRNSFRRFIEMRRQWSDTALSPALRRRTLKSVTADKMQCRLRFDRVMGDCDGSVKTLSLATITYRHGCFQELIQGDPFLQNLERLLMRACRLQPEAGVALSKNRHRHVNSYWGQPVYTDQRQHRRRH